MIRQLILILLIGVTTALSPIEKYVVTESGSSLKILGTSTLHDWEIVAGDFSGNASITIDEGLKIDDLSFKVKVESLESGKSAMDNNTYEALNAKKYPYINYEFSEVTSGSKAGDAYNLNTKGKLTIAGYTKTITMPVMARVSGNQISFAGKITFNMTDFKVDPPRALMGTIKTGDEVTIDFNIKYNNN